MRRLPGSHPANIKNRSSKQLSWLCGPGHKPVYRSMSAARLQELIDSQAEYKTKGQSYWLARKELDRRTKKRAKKEGIE